MTSTTIRHNFWYERLEVNAQRAIFHQWDQLVASGCIENFRIAAGTVDGFREGWFFADSDAYKWLEAAARIHAVQPDPRLADLIDGLIDLLAAAQMPDGYLFTYNQIHFPGVRWQNLQIEHELYCHGHLIEAGVSHYEATGRTDLLDMVHRAADRIVEDFHGKGADYTPGHEEIEIALLRLHHITQDDTAYLDVARQFIEQRGRIPHFPRTVVQQNFQMGQRSNFVQQKKTAYLEAHPDFKPFQLPPDNSSKKSFFSPLRWFASALSGKYFQQHAPIREQIVPVGHSVRFAYLETAVAMLARETGDQTLLSTLEQIWEHMVTRRMYVTGGIGSQPGLEGFGNDYELDPEFAYAETCAALASLFWNWEMAQLTGEAKYSDLFEWQLYNAAAVGMGLDGTTYLYNNPLACRGGVVRQPWYAVPCCPSNISRTWANLRQYIFSTGPGVFCIHQYIGSEITNQILQCENGETIHVSIDMESGLPWDRQVRLLITDIALSDPDRSASFDIQLRQPSWADGMSITINGDPILAIPAIPMEEKEQTASGYDPRRALFQTIQHSWGAGDEVVITFDMPVQLRRAHPKVKGHQGKVAVTRGPLVYCLEDIDNPGIDIFNVRVDPGSFVPVFDPALLGGITRLQATTKDGKPLTLIPYFLWGNRGSSQMTVWMNLL